MSDCFTHTPPKCSHCKRFLQLIVPKTNGEYTDATYWGCFNCLRVYQELTDKDCALHECTDMTIDEFEASE